MSKYLLSDLQVGMHVKIPRVGSLKSSSWSAHLEDNRWWEITEINAQDFHVDDGQGWYYAPSWVSECLELDEHDFSTPVSLDFEALFWR